MKIPKIIHQTWKSNQIPKHLKALSKTWKTFHPEWKFYFWTDKENRKFVVNDFPELVGIYDAFESNIQRADMIRYLILFKIGGVYVDMDFECFENLEMLLKDNLCVFAIEPEEHCVMHKMDTVICNAFMASVPGHSFIKLLIDESTKPIQQKLNPNLIVMETTGPYMVTRVYQQIKNDIEVTIIDPKYVYPLSRREVLFILNNDFIAPEIQKKLDNSFAVHYWLNSWVDFNYK